jgi:hypothetical protein
MLTASVRGGSGRKSRRKAAASWLSAAPDPACRRAAYARVRHVSGPEYAAKTPGCSLCHCPSSTRRLIHERSTPVSRSWRVAIAPA